MRELYRVGPLMLTDHVLHVGNRYWQVRDIDAAFIRKQNGIIYRIGILFWGALLLLGYFTFISPAYHVALLNITLPMDGQELAFGVLVLCGFTLCILNLVFPRKFLVILTSTGEWPVLFSRRCMRLLGAWHAVQKVLHEFEEEQEEEELKEPHDLAALGGGHSAVGVQRTPHEKFMRPARKVAEPGSEARRSSVRQTPVAKDRAVPKTKQSSSSL